MMEDELYNAIERLNTADWHTIMSALSDEQRRDYYFRKQIEDDAQACRTAFD
jgi:hypothetical protein